MKPTPYWGRDSHMYDSHKDTLEELKARVVKITQSIEIIDEFELSPEIKSLAIKELQEKKAELVELMHKKVDEL